MASPYDYRSENLTIARDTNYPAFRGTRREITHAVFVKAVGLYGTSGHIVLSLDEAKEAHKSLGRIIELIESEQKRLTLDDIPDGTVFVFDNLNTGIEGKPRYIKLAGNHVYSTLNPGANKISGSDLYRPVIVIDSEEV